MTQIINFLVAALFGISAHAALGEPSKGPRSAEDFAKSASHAVNWKQFIETASKSIPPYFKDEFSKEAEKFSLPSATFRNSKLTLRDEDGHHVSLEFKDHGRVFLNDKAFEIHPLDNLANELSRVESNFTHVHTRGSFLNFLIPSANAAPSGRGVALASYVVTSGWTDQACGSNDLSAEQKNSCPQTAAAMRASYNQPVKAKFFPIELSCPATEPNGTLDLISKNATGSMNRMRIVYSNYNPKTVEMDVAAPGSSLKKMLKIDLAAKNLAADQEYAEELVIKGNAIKTNVCEGPASNRQRYLAALSKNKSIFLNASRDQDSDDGSDSGKSQQAL